MQCLWGIRSSTGATSQFRRHDVIVRFLRAEYKKEATQSAAAKQRQVAPLDGQNYE